MASEGKRPRLRAESVRGGAGEFAPGDEFDVLTGEQLTEFLAGEEVEIALAPGGAPGVALARGGFHFVVIVAEVDDKFGYAGLEIFEGGHVELGPPGWRDGGLDGDGVIDDDVGG